MKKLYILIAVIIGFAFAVNTNVFAETSVDIDKLKEKIKKELQAEKPWNKDMQEWGVDVHGFVTQGYMHSTDNNFLANHSSNGTFQYGEIGINFSKQITDKLRIGLQLFAHDMGAIGNNDILLDWAFADYRWKDWLGLRVGRIKAPHGLYNETRDIDMLRTNILLPQSVYRETYRDIMAALNGIGVYGDVDLNAGGALSYYLLAGTSDLSNDTSNGPTRQINSMPMLTVDEDFDMGDTYIGSLRWQTPLDGLAFKTTYRYVELGIPCVADINLSPSILAGDPLTYEANYLSMVVYSLEYVWDDLILATEFQKTRTDWAFIDAAGSINMDGTINGKGYYISGSYRVNDWLEAGMYYSMWYPDSTDKHGNDSATLTNDYQAWLEQYVLSLRFDISPNWCSKVEVHRMDGAAGNFSLDNDSYEEHWWMFVAKMSFSF